MMYYNFSMEVNVVDERKDLLIRSAARLYSLGVDLENAKARLRALADAGERYDSPEMANALRAYVDLKKLWDNLEAEHLRLRDEITNGKN